MWLSDHNGKSYVPLTVESILQLTVLNTSLSIKIQLITNPVALHHPDPRSQLGYREAVLTLYFSIFPKDKYLLSVYSKYYFISKQKHLLHPMW